MKESKIFFVKNNKVHISIPVKNKGKFRWKNRKTLNDYGEGFSTDKIPYSRDSYIEWQIGYDVPVKSYENDPISKPTTLNEIKFINLKGVEKYPYELSEYLVAMFDAGIVTNNEIQNLINEVSKNKTSLEEEFKIKMNFVGDYEVDGFLFKQQDITLPTFIHKEKNGNLSVEISIQKQQYATGVQPMLYLIIPITSLENGNEMIGKTAKQLKFNYTSLVIDEKNKDSLLNIFRFFGICSIKHKHDIKEILRLINEYTEKTINSFIKK